MALLRDSGSWRSPERQSLALSTRTPARSLSASNEREGERVLLYYYPDGQTETETHGQTDGQRGRCTRADTDRDIQNKKSSFHLLRWSDGPMDEQTDGQTV